VMDHLTNDHWKSSADPDTLAVVAMMTEGDVLVRERQVLKLGGGHSLPHRFGPRSERTAVGSVTAEREGYCRLHDNRAVARF
jgi:hypothetical protein